MPAAPPLTPFEWPTIKMTRATRCHRCWAIAACVAADIPCVDPRHPNCMTSGSYCWSCHAILIGHDAHNLVASGC